MVSRGQSPRWEAAKVGAIIRGTIKSSPLPTRDGTGMYGRAGNFRVRINDKMTAVVGIYVNALSTSFRNWVMTHMAVLGDARSRWEAANLQYVLYRYNAFTNQRERVAAAGHSRPRWQAYRIPNLAIGVRGLLPYQARATLVWRSARSVDLAVLRRVARSIVTLRVLLGIYPVTSQLSSSLAATAASGVRRARACRNSLVDCSDKRRRSPECSSCRKVIVEF